MALLGHKWPTEAEARQVLDSTTTRKAESFWAIAGEHGFNLKRTTSSKPVKAINILYDGVVSGMNLDALTCAAVAGIMKSINPEVNMVSAPVMAKERGVKISTTRQDKSGVFEGYIKLTVVTDKRERSIGGTVFSDGKPRFIQIKGINIDAEIGQHMLYTTNKDVPGIIGTLGQTMGENGVNIANFEVVHLAEFGQRIGAEQHPPLERLQFAGPAPPVQAPHRAEQVAGPGGQQVDRRKSHGDSLP